MLLVYFPNTKNFNGNHPDFLKKLFKIILTFSQKCVIILLEKEHRRNKTQNTMIKNSNPFITLIEAQARLATLGADPTSHNPWANARSIDLVDWREHVISIRVERGYSSEKYFTIGVHLDSQGFNSFVALTQLHKDIRRVNYGLEYDKLSIAVDGLMEVYSLELKEKKRDGT